MATSTEYVSRRVHVSSKKTTFSSTELIDGLESGGHTHRSGSIGSIMLKVLLCIACGIIFGISLHKANVMDPTVIRRQMLLQQFTMMKFFMSALATSMLSLSVLGMLPFASQAFRDAWKDYFDKFTIRGIATSVVGGSLMGLGMTVSGSCSSSIFPQLGALVPNSQYTFLGALTAVLIYSLSKPLLDEALKPKTKEQSQAWPRSVYFRRALPLVAVLAVGVVVFETFIPSAKEIPLIRRPWTPVLGYNVWPPYVCGMLVGSLQLPLVLFVGKTLGGSTSVSNILAQVFFGPLKNVSPYLANLRWGFESTWQIYYVFGAALGGYISASAAGTLGTSPSVGVMASFWGGFLLYIGTRIGGGCTSGHGLSGLGLMSSLSMVMIAATFGSAISSAFIFRSLEMV